jgi:hypothetical protein
MHGYVDPTRERFALFKELPRDQPIHMLNLVKLCEQAAYRTDARRPDLRPIAPMAAKAGRFSAGSEDDKSASANRC